MAALTATPTSFTVDIKYLVSGDIVHTSTSKQQVDNITSALSCSVHSAATRLRAIDGSSERYRKHKEVSNSQLVLDIMRFGRSITDMANPSTINTVLFCVSDNHPFSLCDAHTLDHHEYL